MPESTDKAKAEVLTTVNQSIQELGDGVRELAIAMKEGAPEAWDIMVRQHTYDALINLGAAVAIWAV
jgi:hypothetical protein